jgi:hypothetical protein
VVFDGKVRQDMAARIGRATSEILHNDFSKATLKSVDFRDVPLSEQTLPSDFVRRE